MSIAQHEMEQNTVNYINYATIMTNLFDQQDVAYEMYVKKCGKTSAYTEYKLPWNRY